VWVKAGLKTTDPSVSKPLNDNGAERVPFYDNGTERVKKNPRQRPQVCQNREKTAEIKSKIFAGCSQLVTGKIK